jgi:transcriptional regulator with XRE-family HTH domain
VIKESTVKAFCVSFSKALKAERERQELSMNALAQKAGISQQMVSYIERGMRSPSLETLFRLSHALEINPWALIQRAARKSEN